VQDFLSSNLLSKNTEIKIHITVTLPVVLYGCESWSVTLREEHKLRVSENWLPRRMFGPKREKVRGSAEYRTMRSSMMCVLHQILFG